MPRRSELDTTAATRGQDHATRTELRRLAFTAFWFHAPGLWIFHRARMGRATRRHNVVFVGLTLLAIALSYPVVGTWKGPLFAWCAGHAVWGAWLTARILRGELGDDGHSVADGSRDRSNVA